MSRPKFSVSGAGGALRALTLAAALGAAPGAWALDMANGGRLYNAHCAGCHGTDGRSANPAAPNLIGGAKTTQADPALVMRIKSGKGQCPPYFGILKDKDILDVIAHVRTLR